MTASETQHDPPLSSPADLLALAERVPSAVEKLARMTALFQQRAIMAAMGFKGTTSNPQKTAENAVICRISAPPQSAALKARALSHKDTLS